MCLTATEHTANPATTSNGLLLSAVDYVRKLSPEDKQRVFMALLREALEFNGDRGLLPIDDEDGKPFGYYVPPKAAQELYEGRGPKLTENEEQEIDRRIKSMHPGIPIEEIIADLRKQEAELQQQPQLKSA